MQRRFFLWFLLKLKKLKILNMSKIILLNGPSSAGKSSLVKAIQHLSEESWLTSGVDVGFATMPAKYLPGGKKAHEGINFVPGTDEKGFPIMKVESGDYGKKVAQSIRKVVKQLADDGHNVILDEVI
jgi:chloramphenicol 3-O phosphotransferase